MKITKLNKLGDIIKYFFIRKVCQFSKEKFIEFLLDLSCFSFRADRLKRKRIHELRQKSLLDESKDVSVNRKNPCDKVAYGHPV